VTAPVDKVWFITRAGRGMGLALARAALEADHRVVATGRDPVEVADAIGAADGVLAVKLDVTRPAEANAAVEAAVERFGRIDVLVNNAGTSYEGYFEEMTPEQVDQQLATNLLGPMNVTRAVLPVMRRQRSGHVISISSGAGLVGFECSSVYVASKFGLEGWMGALQQEIEPFGIETTIVNPGWFRTGLAGPKSAIWPELAVPDYAERSAAQRTWWEAQDGQQAGDPDKLAQALLAIADETPRPRRLIAGADVIALAERKIADLRAQVDAYRELSSSLSFASGVGFA
jgi:NAD(P)-dependent dehydrogenase (short-subunit alcohol dehydrogenase family)